MRCALACIGILALSVPSLASRPLPVMQPGRVAYVDEMSLDVPDGVSWLRVYKEFAPPSIRLQWGGVHVTLLIDESACSACTTLDEHRAFALRVREVKATERGAPLVVLGASTAVSTWNATEQRFDDRDRLRDVVVRHLLLPILASGRAYIAEIVDAARSIAHDAAAGRIRPEDVDEESFAARLDTAGMPDPDLLIRTAGEMRISNFLLWQISYAELWVTPVAWPEFEERHLDEAIDAFAARDRRFGGLSPS